MTHGILIAIAGPMFAGKSETMIQAIQEQKILEYNIKNPLVFKHAWDLARYDECCIVSHSRKKVPCRLLDDDNLKTLCDTDKNHDWIFIDEAQFFQKDTFLDTCSQMLGMGFNLCCAGLNQDSFGKPFGAMGDILASADDIILINSICSVCGLKATKTQRLSSELGTVLVGGNTTYEPRCHLHWTC